MARYSTDHKEKTHAAIVDAAAERIRSGGFDALGVASIMAEAGLTHGGFYAHFPSRDALLAAAITRLFDKACETVSRFEEKHGEAALEKYVDFYLSPRHRDDMEHGCPIPSLAGDAQRAAPQVKAAFEAGLDKLAERLGQLIPKGGKKAALALYGEMVGVLSVSRTIDARQSNELLAAKRKAITI
ncbi:MAG: TetR/AcrR family transcriptional regulator [Alphaproteobacteria bacterium]|jgi:TetR/AcrR family transcriptional repressor of nem operon|nr:MAG: TetR/AcrR family transcriptional regulator [Alphaproteobacteria bacterium]